MRPRPGSYRLRAREEVIVTLNIRRNVYLAALPGALVATAMYGQQPQQQKLPAWGVGRRAPSRCARAGYWRA